MQVKAATIGWITTGRSFIKDVRVEMTKVTWPSWDELKGQTLVVIIAVMLIAAFIGSVDIVLSNIIKLLVRTLTS
jgi:preprotein translocase subunit SecE